MIVNKRKALNILLAVFLAIAMGHSAHAQEWLRSYDEARFAGKPFWESEPVYDERTGSYFQLVRDQKNGGRPAHGPNWAEAAANASSMSYKGRQGRLAVIDSPELYQWILNQWDLAALRGGHGGDTWIGLRYWCPYRQLAWSDGTEHSFTSFAPWARPWYRGDGIRCSKSAIPYMSVYIDPTTLRWRATGLRKRFMHYIVEYPEGGPESTQGTN